MKLKIRTKNHTAEILRGAIETKVPVIFRLGSRTVSEKVFPRQIKAGRKVYEINTVQACMNSADKIAMKNAFAAHEVKTAEWAQLSNDWSVFPCIVKHKHSSKGNGIFLFENAESFNQFVSSHGTENYIVERFYNFSKEYRLHVTKDGCFYSCRKMLKADAKDRWHRHDSNSVWILEENPLFEKPKNWDDIISHCVKSLESVGLDIGACDVKVQSEKGKRNNFTPDFIVLEINSAPALGEVTAQKYIQKLSEIVESFQ